MITNLTSLLTLYFCGWSVEGPNKLLLAVFVQVRLKNKKIDEIKRTKISCERYDCVKMRHESQNLNRFRPRIKARADDKDANVL